MFLCLVDLFFNESGVLKSPTISYSLMYDLSCNNVSFTNVRYLVLGA